MLRIRITATVAIAFFVAAGVVIAVFANLWLGLFVGLLGPAASLSEAERAMKKHNRQIRIAREWKNAK